MEIQRILPVVIVTIVWCW